MIIIVENVMGAMGTDETGEPVLEYGHRLFSNPFLLPYILHKGTTSAQVFYAL